MDEGADHCEPDAQGRMDRQERRLEEGRGSKNHQIYRLKGQYSVRRMEGMEELGGAISVTSGVSSFHSI